MRNIRLLIEYDGSDFHGWQRQPNLRTVQGEIEAALNRITGEKINIIGSGRTDSGVHARGQVANFHTTSKIPQDKFKYALNSVLSRDISIIESEEVDEEFHSRYSAIGKEYRYLIYNHRIRSSLLRNYTYHIPYDLDIAKLQSCTKDFLGEHDFAGFMSSGSSVKDTIRRIDIISVKSNNNIIEIKVKGNGFLYNMVRIMVGTLIDIAQGKLSEDTIALVLKTKDRSMAGHTALPQGLYLERVIY